VGLERGPLSLVSTTEELLGITNSGSGLESEITAVGICHADHMAPSIPQFVTNFADKLLSLSRYSSLSVSGPGVLLKLSCVTLQTIREGEATDIRLCWGLCLFVWLSTRRVVNDMYRLSINPRVRRRVRNPLCFLFRCV
jgi:hypothetical protein